MAEPTREDRTALEAAILVSLDGLLHALELEPLGDDRFRVPGEPGRFDRVFGGQTVAQALVAASATVPEQQPHSMHAYFAEAGAPGQPVDLAVERVRDGRSMSTRRVTVTQDGRPLLVVIASFHTNASGPEVAEPPPPTPGPDELPQLQDWIHRLPPDQGRNWIDHPPPLEMRIGEAPNFLGGPAESGTRGHWMRLPRDVGDSTLLHSALLAYASDYLLLDMAFRSYPEPVTHGEYAAASLDHAVWLHRPVRFDEWHLHTQETVAISGHRGLVRGSIHDIAGNLVATVMQEVLVRPRRKETR